MRGTAISAGLAALWLPILSGTALSQEPAPEPPAAAEPVAPKPKPRPKPKPKPAPKSEAPSETQPEPAAKPSGQDRPPALRTRTLPAADPPAKAEPPKALPPPSVGAFAAPPIACDPGQSVLYDGPRDVSLWVTRTGTVTIDNPLRPLTPDVTRVLQIVVAGKAATAYGPDLGALRRGASPSALEGALGGPIRWDKALGTLPDTLNIVADSGKTIAELHFKTCGEAPAASVAPVARDRKNEKAKSARKPPSAEQAGAAAPSAPPDGPRPSTGAPGEPAPPRKFNLPQGAIPE